MSEALPAKAKSHLWVKGQRGNAKGRTPGSKNQITLLKMQVEGELRTRMKGVMPAVVDKMIEMALAGDGDMLKTLYKSWVTGTKVADEEPSREKIQITIGKLDSGPPIINGTIINQSKGGE